MQKKELIQMKKTRLKKYAELIARCGVNIQSGQ